MPGRIVRTPLVLQFQATECGAACLGIILAYYGRWVSLAELRKVCGVSRDACSAGALVRAAAEYGVHLEGRRRELHQLKRPDVRFPMILFVEFSHFVVLEGYGRGRYFLNDPASGRRSVSESEFSRSFTGVALIPKLEASFEPDGQPPSVRRMLSEWIVPVRTQLSFAAACGLLLAIPGLSLPLLLSVLVDHVLIGGQPQSWQHALTIGAAMAAISTYILSLLQRRCLRKLSIRLSVVHGTRFVKHLFELPLEFFVHRLSGDLTERVRVIERVAVVAASHVAATLIEVVLSILFLALLFVFNPLLALITALFAFANIAITRFLSRLRNDECVQMRREQATLLGVGMMGLNHIDTLQASAAEDDLFVKWSGHQARELNARQRFFEFGCMIASMPDLFIMLNGASVLAIGGWLVMSGDMTLGALMAAYLLAANFMRPVGNFVGIADILQTLETDLLRIKDIVDAAAEEAVGSRIHKLSLARQKRLSGRIELCDVTFGYRPKAPPLIDKFCLSVEPGQRIAIVGTTGSGKSTLLALISGVIKPWSGQILFDGLVRDELPRLLTTGSIAVVDQRPVLFTGSIRENLTMWNPTISESRLIAAGRDACLNDDIMGRSGGYDAVVEEGGRNFSGGQRQRIEIARALATDAPILLLDEATSALDAVSEERIDDAVRRRGCTCIIVAHRYSTIRDCDRIIVMKDGRQVQSGTHEALIADESGHYSQLAGAA